MTPHTIWPALTSGWNKWPNTSLGERLTPCWKMSSSTCCQTMPLRSTTPTWSYYAILFSMVKFLPFIDLERVEMCKTIVGTLNINQTYVTSNPLIINGITYLWKVIHDSLDSLSIKYEQRQASSLVCEFVEKVDFEQQLSFYVDVRENFSNLSAMPLLAAYCLHANIALILPLHHTNNS